MANKIKICCHLVRIIVYLPSRIDGCLHPILHADDGSRNRSEML